MKAIGYFVVTLFLVAYAAIMGGWVLSKLWVWFICSTFGATPITIPAAIGLSLIISYLTHQVSSDKKEESEDWGLTLVKGFVVATVRPLLILSIGALVTLWM